MSLKFLSSSDEYKAHYKTLQNFRKEIKQSFNENLNLKTTVKSWDDGVKKVNLLFLLSKPIDQTSLKPNQQNKKQIQKDSFFKSKKHEEIFYLLNFEKGFNEELQITRRHYLDKKAAKNWRDQLLKKYHNSLTLDKNGNSRDHDFSSETYTKIEANILLIYKRMTGDA